MVSLFVVLILLGPMPSPSLKTDSTTESSVAVVSRPNIIVLAKDANTEASSVENALKGN